MKSLLIVLGLSFTALTSHTSQSQVCIAQKDHHVSWGSNMKYHVSCRNTGFDSPYIVTSFIFPIPYNWDLVARNKLGRVMLQKGYSPAAIIEGLSSATTASVCTLDPILVFDLTTPSSTEKNYCLAIESAHRKIGIDRRTSVYDYDFACSNGEDRDQLSGITRAEFEAYMQKIGVGFAFKTKVLKKQGQSILVFE